MGQQGAGRGRQPGVKRQTRQIFLQPVAKNKKEFEGLINAVLITLTNYRITKH